LRVLSWNLSFGEGTDAATNWNRTATWIASFNPDIAALCEVPPDSISTLVNLVTQKTGRTWYWYFVPKYPDCPEGNLVLSKYSFVSTSYRYLSYDRSVAQVTINFGGRNVNFFATHLDPSSSTARYQQVTELQSFAGAFSEPRLGGGDFNAGPDLSEIIQMTSNYYDSWMEAMNIGTASAYPDNPVYWQTRTRRGRIDYIFYSRWSGIMFMKSAQIPDVRDYSNPNVVIKLGIPEDNYVRPSDHNPMIAVIEIR
jgi:endonuclease/exonuclease/phosphatase family metal-dependent hydrolase